MSSQNASVDKIKLFILRFSSSPNPSERASVSFHRSQPIFDIVQVSCCSVICLLYELPLVNRRNLILPTLITPVLRRMSATEELSDPSSCLQARNLCLLFLPQPSLLNQIARPVQWTSFMSLK